MRREPGRSLSKTKLAEAISEIGIIVTVRVPNEQQLLRVVNALIDGGVRAVELAYTSIRSAGGTDPRTQGERAPHWHRSRNPLGSSPRSPCLRRRFHYSLGYHTRRGVCLRGDEDSLHLERPHPHRALASTRDGGRLRQNNSRRSSGRSALHPFPTRDATRRAAGRCRHAAGWIHSLSRRGCRGARVSEFIRSTAAGRG